MYARSVTTIRVTKEKVLAKHSPEQRTAKYKYMYALEKCEKTSDGCENLKRVGESVVRCYLAQVVVRPWLELDLSCSLRRGPRRPVGHEGDHRYCQILLGLG